MSASNEEPPRKRSRIANNLPAMMYGFGDSVDQDPETVALVEALTEDYIRGVTRKAKELADIADESLHWKHIAFLFKLDSSETAPKHAFGTRLRERPDELIAADKKIRKAKQTEATDGALLASSSSSSSNTGSSGGGGASS